MESNVQERLAGVIELVHNAQAELLENVSPPEDPAEAQKHYDRAATMLRDALFKIRPLCSPELFPFKPGSAA